MLTLASLLPLSETVPPATARFCAFSSIVVTPIFTAIVGDTCAESALTAGTFAAAAAAAAGLAVDLPFLGFAVAGAGVSSADATGAGAILIFSIASFLRITLMAGEAV